MNEGGLSRRRTPRNTVRVADTWEEAEDIRVFVLESVDASPLPAPAPGAHIDIDLGPGLIRQYSICNGPEETSQYVIAVKREPMSRGGSLRMHMLRKGDRLEVSDPCNAFSLKPGAAQTLLLAGGIGITPLISMAKHLAYFKNAFHLHNFTRSIQASAFRNVLQSSDFAENVTFHDGLLPDGVQRALRDILLPAKEESELYCCGPAAFMESVRNIIAGSWDDAAVHWESFKPQVAVCEAEFQLTFAQSDKTVLVGPNERIIDVAARCGIAIATSCEQGVCGTCVVRVIGGTPDHRDMYLNEAEKAEGNQMCACVSRSRSRNLILDL